MRKGISKKIKPNKLLPLGGWVKEGISKNIKPNKLLPLGRWVEEEISKTSRLSTPKAPNGVKFAQTKLHFKEVSIELITVYYTHRPNIPNYLFVIYIYSVIDFMGKQVSWKNVEKKGMIHFCVKNKQSYKQKKVRRFWTNKIIKRLNG